MSKNNAYGYKRHFGQVNRFPTQSSKMESQMILAAQCRAARGLLGWSQQDLATRAGVGVVTIRQLEAGHQPRRATLSVVRSAFESSGIEFIDENGGGAGVRLANPGSYKSP